MKDEFKFTFFNNNSLSSLEFNKNEQNEEYQEDKLN